MEKITLFTNILPEEQEAMRVCMQARELTFSAHEILMEYSCSMKKIGLILEGEALLYCCDADGTEYILDELSPDSVFGEPFLLSSNSQHYYVQAKTSVRVLFIDYQHCSESPAADQPYLSAVPLFHPKKINGLSL